MAAPANLVSNTLENQLAELIERIRDKQEAKDATGNYTKNPDSVFVITNYQLNGIEGMLEATIALPVNITIDSVNGALQALAPNIYLD
jgi:hypothetical protein